MEGDEGARSSTVKDVEEVLEKPQSMLSPRVKQVLLEVIEREERRALEEGDHAYLIDLQNAKKLILRGAWKVRKSNPYLLFVSECIAENRPEGKMTLEEAQRLFKSCAEKWRGLSKEKKREYEVRAGELMVYDYL